MNVTSSEEGRWQRARAFALRQRCDQSAACEYADWIVTGAGAGYITPGAAHAPLFAHWLAEMEAQG